MISTWRYLTGIAVFSALFSMEPAWAAINRVWAVDDGEKIKRDDITHPLASDPNNLVWNGTTIQLFGAKNEIVAFQLIT